MLYYRVNPKFDQIQRPDGSVYVANELYTKKELERMKLNQNYMEEISISKNDTYMFFGARFQIRK